jgi:hypothetical protein
VARKPEVDSKWNGVEGRTIPIEDATPWVFNEWVERNNLAQRPIKNWEQQRSLWTSQGVEEELQIKCEADMVAEMVSSLLVFVLKNLGTYYSGAMLMYATGTNAQRQLISTGGCVTTDCRAERREKLASPSLLG